MSIIAAKCPHCKVTVVDMNASRISAWNSESLPIYEPGLLEIVRSTRGRNLFFSTDINAAIRDSELIFVSVNTPTKTSGEGAGKAADLQYWEKVARDILRECDTPRIVVEKSTLPVMTARTMEDILNANRNGIHFEVVSNPEFLAEGTAIHDLLEPDRVLIGSHETPEGLRARQELIELYANWVPRERIITSDVWSTELAKLAANAFLAQRISSINSISALCEETGSDVAQIGRAVGLDSRIGTRFLNVSAGFGGSCFKKDILNLVYICQSRGLHEVAAYWESVLAINEYQRHRFVRKILRAMSGTVSGKRLALFGFAFKAGTCDTRESTAAFVARKLAEERARVVVTDPRALENARVHLGEPGGDFEFLEDPYEAAAGANAVAIMTEWELYRLLDWKRIHDSMRKPAFIFDGRNILDHERLFDMGFNVYPLGCKPLVHD